MKNLNRFLIVCVATLSLVLSYINYALADNASTVLPVDEATVIESVSSLEVAPFLPYVEGSVETEAPKVHAPIEHHTEPKAEHHGAHQAVHQAEVHAVAQAASVEPEVAVHADAAKVAHHAVGHHQGEASTHAATVAAGVAEVAEVAQLIEGVQEG